MIDGLAHSGVLGMTAPQEVGGRGMSQMAYCSVMEEIGSRCASTAIFVNAQHSIGMRALLLFGTREQKQRWLPPLVRGEQLAAFALTETEAGSDAANVQTTATPAPTARTSSSMAKSDTSRAAHRAGADGDGADTRAGADKTSITAFLVTPDMPGFTIIESAHGEARDSRDGDGRFAFHDMPVPRENILGRIGQRVEGRADGARFWPDHVRRLLHRRGEDLLCSSRSSHADRAGNSIRRSATSS